MMRGREKHYCLGSEKLWQKLPLAVQFIAVIYKKCVFESSSHPEHTADKKFKIERIIWEGRSETLCNHAGSTQTVEQQRSSYGKPTKSSGRAHLPPQPACACALTFGGLT